MLAPYLDRHGDAGAPVRTQEELDPLVTALDRAGFQIHVHAIGDRAIRMTLDALARARAVNGVRDSRHAIAHLEPDGLEIVHARLLFHRSRPATSQTTTFVK